MSKCKNYIASFRLRTLPLSISGIVLGSLLAMKNGHFDFLSFSLAIATTLCLQILSNLANELGDYQKGTDNEKRLGPIRSIQTGVLTSKEFKYMIFGFVFLSILFGAALVYVAFKDLFSPSSLIMLLLGAISIVAAIKYTLGKGAYGYHGWGDLFVFLFFGPLSVVGSWFLMTQSLSWIIFLPGSSIGLLAASVLNLNNMRDIENDEMCGKRTIPVLIGLSKAKIVHQLLIGGAFISITIYMVLQHLHPICFLYLLTLPLFFTHLIKTKKSQGKELDTQFKPLTLSTLLFALLVSLGYCLAF